MFASISSMTCPCPCPFPNHTLHQRYSIECWQRLFCCFCTHCSIQAHCSLSLIALLIAAVLHQQLLPTKMPRPTLAASLFILLSISSIAHSTNSAGELFLSENALKAGVTVLPSGLQYSVIISGSGRESPFSNTSCLLHYAGTLIDGTEFDSSYRRGKVSAAG